MMVASLLNPVNIENVNRHKKNDKKNFISLRALHYKAHPNLSTKNVDKLPLRF
ncbi:hypothetical protein VIBC2010_02180 [Vibrio caribbeanicus ATCC BAA-2122]|uniref:Uncharacterized protein n=1 Tax=Vibrio caribbeanicus ATCC BAA-2122 TaxID=796620 RepID=E3BLE7_9VIBR|nr:hypothetical protein VIBC2010_02180 [Vibrio caribbeanicus ATCC BAA-2122]